MLELILNYHKRKLNYMIERNYSYDKILEQSRRVDKWINEWIKIREFY